MTNRFDNRDGDQNIAQGDGAIGRQDNIGQEVDGDNSIFSGTGNVTVNKHYGISEERADELKDHLSITDLALRNFFKILEEQQIPRDDLDAKLREIAATHKELLARLATVQSEDPEVQRLKQEAGQAIEAGEYDKAEDLLNQAEALDLKAIEELEQAAKQRRISAATTNVDQAKLQEVQLRYAKAAEYWQKAAALLPEGEKKDRAYYLNEAGNDLYRIARYSEALPLYEQSLAISQEIGDRAGEGTTLNNISQIYDARGDYATALKYLEQSLDICREIGDRAGEGTTLNNISQIYDAQGEYATALKYLEQSLAIRQEIGDRAGEGTTLNNISQIYDARGEYDTALKYLEQSLAIRQEIGDRAGEDNSLNNIGQIYKARGDYATALKYYEQSLAIQQEIGNRYGEAVTSWNIGHIYKDQGDLARAERYMARTVEIDEAIGHPDLGSDRKALEELRAAMKGR
ncbi:MAG: tetratricopeptide repeat protein [Candidatus Electrothrix sp. YB6]